MSVYTPVCNEDLQAFLRQYQAGELLQLDAIHDGIENTNYFVTTHQGDYVLTLFETADEPSIEFTLNCMAHFAQQGLPCASPLADRLGHYLNPLHQKPASLVPRLTGRSEARPNAAHCREVGLTLANMHLAGQAIRSCPANQRGASWRQAIIAQIEPHLDSAQRRLLEHERQHPQPNYDDLPRGIIHADLFRDNVLFVGTKLTGLLDLYDAGEDLWLYDLAITVNDWCNDGQGLFDMARLKALLTAYDAVRPVTAAEQTAWPDMLRLAALRFWLSRLYSLYFPRDAHLTQQKNPLVYQQLLLNYQQHPPVWPI